VTEDTAFYERAVRRLDWFAVILTMAAVVAFVLREGWRGGLGCAVMAAASLYHLRRLKAVVESIGDGVSGRPRTGSAVALGMRYLILGALCFVIIEFFGVSLAAIFTGLLISAAAVLAEIVYELLFIR
jgi:hypothetical protein